MSIKASYQADGTRTTPEQWREKSKQARMRSAESFDRCDTDGFLSQWASNMTALEYDAWARLAEDSYMGEFEAVFDLEGNLLNARYVQTQYGWSWAITNPDGTTTWFTPSAAQKEETRVKNNRKKGFYVGTVRREAVIDCAGGSMTLHYFRSPVRDSIAHVVDNGR